MAKKLTKAKAREILHDKEVHGHPLTDKQRRFFGAIASGHAKYEDGGWLDKYADGGNQAAASKPDEGVITKFVKDRLSKNLQPIDYNDPIKRLFNTVVLNKKEPTHWIGEDRMKSSKDAFNLYLQRPQENNTFSPSKFKPSKSNEPDQNYYASSELDDQFKEYATVGKIGSERLNLYPTYISSDRLKADLKTVHDQDARFVNTALGSYKIDMGDDHTGKYLSYYDAWNLNPYKGDWIEKDSKITRGLSKILGNKEDLSMGIGKPFEVYNRIYYEPNPTYDQEFAQWNNEFQKLRREEHEFDTMPWNSTTMDNRDQLRLANARDLDFQKRFLPKKNRLTEPRHAGNYISSPPKLPDFTPPYLKFKDGGDIPKAQVGLTAAGSNMIRTPEQATKFFEKLDDTMAAPRRSMINMLTGKYEDPSDFLGIRDRPGLALAYDIGLDPLLGISELAGLAKLMGAGYKTAVGAAKAGTLYNYNPFAYLGSERMAYRPITAGRTQSMLEGNPLMRWAQRGKAENYLPVLDEQGNVSHYVVKNDAELFRSRGGTSNMEATLALNTKKGRRFIPTTVENLLTKPLPKGADHIRIGDTYIHKIPRTRGKVNTDALLKEINEIVYKDAGYSNISPDVRFTKGKIPGSNAWFEAQGHKPTPIIAEADPEIVPMVGAPGKAERAKFIPKDSGEFEPGKRLIPRQALDEGELSADQLNLLRWSPSRGYVPLTPQELQGIRETGQYVAPPSRLAEGILRFDQGLTNLQNIPKNMLKNVREFDAMGTIASPISFGRGMYAGLKQPVSNNYLLADQAFTDVPDVVYQKMNSLRKINSLLTSADPATKKGDIIKILEASPFDGEELYDILRRLPRSTSQDILNKPGVVDMIANKTNHSGNIFDPVITPVNSEVTLPSKGQEAFQKGYGLTFNKRQTAADVLNKQRFEEQAFPMHEFNPRERSPQSLISSMYRTSTPDINQTIQNTVDNLLTADPGIYYSSGSLSAQSYPLTATKLTSLAKSPGYEILRGSDYMELNTLDDFAQFLIPSKYRAAYVNNFLKRVNVEGKKFPSVKFDDDAVYAPRMYIKKTIDTRPKLEPFLDEVDNVNINYRDPFEVPDPVYDNSGVPMSPFSSPYPRRSGTPTPHGYNPNTPTYNLTQEEIDALDTLDFKNGGVIQDDAGYWNPNNWGKPVQINSNDITMRGVNQPLLGVSDQGDMQLMQPGKNYKFKGKKVTEYPIAKNGSELTKLDQLTNFTNYNKPARGGWLDKYQ